MSTPTPSLLTVGDRTFKQYAQPPLMTIDPSAGYTAIVRTNKGVITLELFASAGNCMDTKYIQVCNLMIIIKKPASHLSYRQRPGKITSWKASTSARGMS